jgi:putative transposase
MLNPGVSEYLEKLFPKIVEPMPGCEIITCNIQIDHIHMVMIIPPKYAVKQCSRTVETEDKQGVKEKV